MVIGEVVSVEDDSIPSLSLGMPYFSLTVDFCRSLQVHFSVGMHALAWLTRFIQDPADYKGVRHEGLTVD